jgi:hypothetical protein
MSKKKAEFYTLSLLADNRPYATITFFDRRERRMLSSVDVVLNLEYYTEETIGSFIISR